MLRHPGTSGGHWRSRPESIRGCPDPQGHRPAAECNRLLAASERDGGPIRFLCSALRPPRPSGKRHGTRPATRSSVDRSCPRFAVYLLSPGTHGTPAEEMGLPPGPEGQLH
jgi:hypothetical protein